jgi:hypothetical protein
MGISQIKKSAQTVQIRQLLLGPDEEGRESHKSHVGVRRPVPARPFEPGTQF